MVERFTDVGNGTVRDNLTKLVWLKNANAFGQRNWTRALLDAKTLANGSAGLSDGSEAGDWRLPDVKELNGLIDFAYYDPALPNASGKSKWVDGDAFIGVQSGGYWSNTNYSGNSASAWGVGLDDGGVYGGNKTNTGYVWPVRAEQ